MSSLYELTETFMRLKAMLMDPEADEQLITDSMECIDCEIEEKADAYAFIKRDMEGDIEKIDKEIERLKERKTMIENRKKRLMENLMATMRATGKEKFKTALNSFGIRKAGGKQPLSIDIEDPEKIPKEYRKEVVKYSADNDKIREALDKGEKLSWARYAERTEYLSIR